MFPPFSSTHELPTCTPPSVIKDHQKFLYQVLPFIFSVCFQLKDCCITSIRYKTVNLSLVEGISPRRSRTMVMNGIKAVFYA